MTTPVVLCERCGHDRVDHWLCNCTDGNIVGKFFLVCPTAVFHAKGFDVGGEPLRKDKDGSRK